MLSHDPQPKRLGSELPRIFGDPNIYHTVRHKAIKFCKVIKLTESKFYTVQQGGSQLARSIVDHTMHIPLIYTNANADLFAAANLLVIFATFVVFLMCFF